jgi:hypothetical protein
VKIRYSTSPLNRANAMPSTAFLICYAFLDIPLLVNMLTMMPTIS